MTEKTINQFTALSGSVAGADELALWDASAAGTRRVSVTNFIANSPNGGLAELGAVSNTFTGNLNFANGGSQVAPRLAVAGDADTGFYSNSANTLRCVVGGLLTLLMDGTGSIPRISIGGLPVNASALLELNSTGGALLISRMTTTQRDALTPVNGMVLYNSTTNKFQGYENGAWANLI